MLPVGILRQLRDAAEMLVLRFLRLILNQSIRLFGGENRRNRL